MCAYFDLNKTLHELFEETASQFSSTTAIVDGNKSLSYQELNDTSNQLAHFLRSKTNYETIPLVALFLDKSFEMITSILGIWKSGGGYVPIDPSYPNDRINFILQDTNANIIFTSSNYSMRLMTLISSQQEIAEVDKINFDSFPLQNNLFLPLKNDSYAYMMYTSGSTGTPKGILKTHKSVVYGISAISEEYKLDESHEENIVLFSSYVYEPFLRQMLMALLNGQKLIIVNDQIKRDPKMFEKFLIQNEITLLNGTASMLQEYNFKNCKTLKKLIFAGEELTEHCYKHLRKSFDGEIMNEYGPTECTFVSCLKIYHKDMIRDNRSIGKPLKNVKCYVLDENMTAVSTPGIIGELYISGTGVAEGYFKLPQKTAERFYKNIFHTENEKDIFDRIYKTGDLVKWLPNGELEFLGRNDFQIKINGIRIEPGEIEATLLKHASIKNAIVASNLALKMQKTNGNFLIGFYTVTNNNNENVTEKTLKSFLSKKLPAYMIPRRLILIHEIPKSVNGKIDFTVLAKIYQETEADNFSDNEILCNEFEGKIIKILSNLLRLPSNFIGIEDNIFELGADSITVIHFISEIRSKMNIELTVTQIFANPNVKMLTKMCEKSLKESVNSNLNQAKIIDSKTSIFPANNMQQCFIYNHMKINDDTYIIQYECQYKTKLNYDFFKEAWNLALVKFPSLRLRFEIEKDAIYQIIDLKQKLIWQYIDLTNVEDYNEKIKITQENDRLKTYNVEKGNLLRLYLFKINESEFYFLFSCHHIILDGWSISVLFNCVHHSYLKLLNGETISVNEDSAFKDAQIFFNKPFEENLKYWNNYFESEFQRPDLNGLLKDDKKNKINISQRNYIIYQKEVSFKIQEELYFKLKNKLQIHGITINSFLQYSWAKLLSNYGNCKQITLGTVISGRNIPIPNITNSVGLYINTLPFLINFDELDQLKLFDAIKNLQAKVFEICDHSNVRLNYLKKREFDSMFVFENYQSLKNAKDFSGAEKELNFKVLSTHEKLDFPLTLVVAKLEESLQIKIVFDEEIFAEDVMQQLLNNMQEIVYRIGNNLNGKISDFECLCLEQQNIMDFWNEESKIEYPQNQTLHGIFEEMVEKHPPKTAVIFENKLLTYEELNKAANQLARNLRHTGLIKPNSIIALFLEKAELMITAILGIWKSGGGYVPIDPSYPNDRINFILQDTQAKIIITNKFHVSKLKEFISNKILIIEAEFFAVENLSESDSNNLSHINGSHDLAYVIYTSGTTGNPKGVMVEHIGVVNLCFALRDLFNLQEKNETILSFSNYVFDHFIEQMLDALLNGETLLILNDEMRVDKARLYKYMSKNDVTYLSGTPSVLKMYDYDQFDSSSLKRIDAVGEDFSETVFNEIRRMFKGLIINGYGPTEVSITTHKKLYFLNDKRNNKSIGKQISNICSYILNENLHRVPIGAIGELYLGGIGVARGYLNRPDLTAERFLVNPFQTEEEKHKNENDRIYKTGDLVRFLSNGEVEFLGRNDFQVKINGSRVELGEIETALSLYPGIKQCIVIAKDVKTKTNLSTSKKYLIGYYISDNAAIICEQNIKTFLRSKLPSHMILNRLCKIDKIPVTISGKLDSKNLPHVEYSYNVETYIPPKNDLQKKLCQIWSELLEIPVNEIGIEDDFFNLGGDSIMSVKLYFTLSREFSLNINSNIFQLRTIKTMAKFVEENQNSNTSKCVIYPENEDESLLSFAQERIFFIEQFEEGGTNAYNVYMHYCIKKGDVKIEILKEAFLKVIKRHDVLRTIIVKNSAKQQNFQKVLNFEVAKSMFYIDEIHVKNDSELLTEMKNAEKYHFDLQNDLPIQVYCYFKNQQFTHLTINIHHIFFDGWSRDILENELEHFYKVLSSKNEQFNDDLPSNDITYRDYAVWQRKQINNDEKMEELKNYWKKKFQNFEALNLPKDYKRPSNFDYQAGCEISFELDEETTTFLKELAKQLKVTLCSILMGTYCMMLGNFAYQKSVIIGTAVTTRCQPELENLIGLFVNMLAMNIQQNPTQKLAEYFQMVNAEIHEAKNHQEIPFEKLVKEYSCEKDLSQHPIFQVVFNMEEQRKIETKAFEDLLSAFNQYKCGSSNVTTTKYDLLTSIRNTSPKIEGYFNFYTKIFHPSTIENMKDSYIFMLENLAKIMNNGNNFNLEIGTLKLIDPIQRQIISSLKMGNHIETTNTKQTLNEIFDSVAERCSVKVALEYGNHRFLTYGELKETANNLSNYLQKTDLIKPNSIVALFLEKDELMITSILGIWKSGGGYVPIDPSYPNDRIYFILQDTQAKIIITNKFHVSKLKKIISNEIIIIEAEFFAAENHETTLNTNILPSPKITCDNLAYVIYTSGSTSNPKGVLVSHRNVTSFYNDITQRYFTESDNFIGGILFLSNYAFDFSIEQFILSFLSGNKLIIVPKNIPIGSDGFYNYVTKAGVTYISGTPSQLQLINFKNLPTLKYLTVAGEAFQNFHFEHIRKGFNGIIRNAYGTTETTVYNFIQTFLKNDNFKNSLGKPLTNTQMYVLNHSLHEIPPGAIGKLYLSGDCISHGYLNRTNENAKNFIFKNEGNKNKIMYNTGDLVRWNKDRNLEYIGRDDFQVKINGLRIELSEIKNSILNYPQIQQCEVIVVVEGGGNSKKQIIAFYICENNEKIQKKHLFNFISQKLPTFMIPKKIIQLFEPFPMTFNGKLDERALKKLSFTESPQNGIHATPPSNYFEEKLCKIWENLLNFSEVGIEDDFFALGGDSILVMQLAEHIYNEFYIIISLKDVFVHRCIKNLAQILQNDENGNQKEVNGVKIDKNESVLFQLLPIQKWFFSKNLINLNHWNQTFTIKIPKQLDFKRLQKALTKLIEFHEAFRLRFKKGDKNFEHFQYYTSMDDAIKNFKLNYLSVADLGDQEINEIIENSQEILNIYTGPLFVVYYLHEFKDGTSKIIFSLHHLIVDVVSWRIICRDLERLYNDDTVIRAPMNSYLQWVDAVNQHYLEKSFLKEKQWWKELIQKTKKFNQILIDNFKINNQHHSLTFSISAEQTQHLLCYSIQRFQLKNINTILLAAFGHCLSSLTGQKQNYITMEGHGRENEGENLNKININNTVGWFTTMYPFELCTAENGDLKQEIENIKTFEGLIPNNGLGFGCLIGYDELPRICFNYLGQLDISQKFNHSSWTIGDIDKDYKNRNDSTHFSSCSDKNIIDLLAFVVNGKMEFRLFSKLEIAKTQNLINDFKKALEEIIFICSNKNTQNGPIFKPFVEFHKNQKNTIFVLPPGEGGAESYARIIHKFSNFHLILFNNYYLYHKQNDKADDENSFTFEGLAKLYIGYIKSLQPEGPYTFIGWSFGGILALEITRQLIDKDELVDNLIIIDSYFNVQLALKSLFGTIDDKTIIDKINVSYSPSKTSFEKVASSIKNLILFRAKKLNTMYKNEKEKMFYEFYMNTKFNNLDTLFNFDIIKIIPMNDDNHISWIFNENMTDFLGNYCTKLFESHEIASII